jgi:Tfp pilus assembly protein PilF
LSTQALDLNNSDRGELTAQSVRYPTEIDTIVADQTAASPLVKKKLRKLMSTGLIAAIVLVAVAVAVGIGVKTVSYFKTVASINVDRTAPEEKAGVPPRHAAVAVPQQPTDNTVSASETPVPDVLKAVPQMLKQKPAEEIIDSDKKSAPANPMPTVVSSPLPGIKPFPEAKPKIQNKPTTKGFADLTPNKTSRAFQPTTLELASAALKQQNFKMAIELLEADRSRDARNSQKTKELYSKALVGQAGRTMKKSPSEAEGLLRIAVENDPGNVRAHFNLGKVYTQTKVYALAIDAYQKAVTLNPNFSDAIFNLGFIYAETGKYKEAEKLFARVVRLKPSYLDKALFNLAMVQEKLGKEKESLAILQKAAAVRPENQKVRAYLKQAENGVKESP